MGADTIGTEVIGADIGTEVIGADIIDTEGGVVINIDDLTDPVLTDVQRQILDYTE